MTQPLRKLLLILALLICNAARGLASGLAGGLTLAAATVINGLGNILSFNSLDSLHNSISHIVLISGIIISQPSSVVKYYAEI